MEFGSGILLVLITIESFLAQSQEINNLAPGATMESLPRDNAETLNDEEIVDLMSLDLGTASPPLEPNASLLDILESLEYAGESPPPSPLPDSPELAPPSQKSQADPFEKSPERFFNPISPPAEEGRRYPSPLLGEPTLEGIPTDIYRNRPYNLFLPRGHIIRPNLILKPPRENRLPPFQTLMPVAKESFFPLTIQHLQGQEKVRVNTYGILKPVNLNVALARAAMANPHLLIQAQAMRNATRGVPPTNQGPPRPPRLENMGRLRRAAPPSLLGPPPTRPPMPTQLPYNMREQQPIDYQRMRMYGYPQQIPFYPAYAQPNFFPGNIPAQPGYYQGQRGMGQIPIPAYGPYQQYPGSRQEYGAPIGFSGGSLDPYRMNGGPNYSNYMGLTGTYVRPPPPYPQYFHPQQLIPFHPNQQGGYAYQPGHFPGQFLPPPQSYAQPEKHGEGLFRPGAYTSNGPVVRKTPPSAAVGSEGTPSRVSPTTYYTNLPGYTSKWPASRQSPYQAYSGGGEAGRPPAQGGPTLGPSQQNNPTTIGGTRVNPYIHFRRPEPVDGPPVSLRPPEPTHANDNAIPGAGPSRNFTRPQPGSQLEGQVAKPEGGQVAEVPVLPTTRRPMPFYSQAAVDSHYRRVSAHNETAGDKEFEDDSQLLQWYVQRAKQVLRERNGKERNGNEESKSNSTEVGPGALPIPIRQERRRRSIESSNDILRPGILQSELGAGWNQFQADWKSGDNGHVEELPTDPGSLETDQLLRKIWDSTGLVFNGSVVLPNGFL